MDTMTTVSEILNKLKKQGYSIDFNLKESCLECQGNYLQLLPGEFEVDRTFRFEGLSDPADEAIVYAISSPKYGIKGTLINGYGIYSDNMVDEMIKALDSSKNEAKHTSNKKTDLNMENKFNEATPQRPEGERPLDAPMVIMDLPSFVEQIKQEPSWKDSDRNSITIFKTDGMRIVMIALHEGAELKTHSAAGVISVQVLEGQMRFTTEKQTAELNKGQMLALHEGIAHSVFANMETVFLLTLAMKKQKTN